MGNQLQAEARTQPFLTMNGAIKVMAAADAIARENIIRTYKFPDPEGAARSHYYGPARDAIHSYHASGNDIQTVWDAIEELEDLRLGASPRKAQMIDSNLRVLRAYPGAFGRRFLAPISRPEVATSCEGVELALRAEMVATERKRTRVLRIGFAKEPPSETEERLSTQFLLYYARQAGLAVSGPDCQLLVVCDARAVPATGQWKSFEARLTGAMREVRHHWPHVKRT